MPMFVVTAVKPDGRHVVYLTHGAGSSPLGSRRMRLERAGRSSTGSSRVNWASACLLTLDRSCSRQSMNAAHRRVGCAIASVRSPPSA